MKDREQAASVAIIGGADGPTSIFMTGKGGKIPLAAERIKFLNEKTAASCFAGSVHRSVAFSFTFSEPFSEQAR